jgi:hypothetical protein
MRSLPLILCATFIFGLSTFAAENTPSPKTAKTPEEITKTIEGNRGFGCIQTAQFSHDGVGIFAVWYCPFSGRAACYLHAYYYDYDKSQWVLFLDRLVEGASDLSAEIPTRSGAVVFKSTDGKIVEQQSIEKFPMKKWYPEAAQTK